MHLGSNLQQYYNNLHLNKNMLYLYANRVLVQVAAGMLSVFTAVFFYEQFGESFTAVALIFTVAYGLVALFTPLSAQLISKICLKKMLIVAIFFLPLTILSLTLWDINWKLSLGLYIAFGTLFRALYWTPYHIDVAAFTGKKDRGKQLSFFSNISEIVLSVTPFISGIILAAYGYNSIFYISSIFLAVSIVPLFFLEETCEVYEFKYGETFVKLFSKENRSLLFAYSGDGIQSSVRIIIWPIFIFILLSGEYAAIGLVTSLTILALIGIRFLIGGLADRWDRTKLLAIGTFFAATGWIFKVFIETGFQIFVADSYHRMGSAVNRLSADIVMYDHAADNGHYIDEFTVLREVALNGSRAVVLILSIFIVSTFGIVSMFLIAAAATILMNLINKEVKVA